MFRKPRLLAFVCCPTLGKLPKLAMVSGAARAYAVILSDINSGAKIDCGIDSRTAPQRWCLATCKTAKSILRGVLGRHLHACCHDLHDQTQWLAALLQPLHYLDLGEP
jgi:hypothetical protein